MASDTIERRREQNRTHSKAYQQRKDTRIVELELQVKELELIWQAKAKAKVCRQCKTSILKPSNEDCTSTVVDLREKIRKLEMANEALRLRLRGSQSATTIAPCILPVSTPKAPTGTYLAEHVTNMDHTMPRMNPEPVRRELKGVPSLADHHDLIDALCNLFITPSLRLDTIAQETTRRRKMLLDLCSNEDDKLEVAVVMDRSRRQNASFFNRVRDIAEQSAVRNYSCVQEDRELDHERSVFLAHIRDLPTKAPSLQNAAGAQLLQKLENLYKNHLMDNTDYTTLAIVEIKFKLVDMAESVTEREAILHLFLLLGTF
ncbi:hypothetical protein BDR26DRAFT_852529 [Obelidium mucronatum]|nr:hypothetical protein BDR26DRAFT_852529 [Obelidium mucronatum]